MRPSLKGFLLGLGSVLLMGTVWDITFEGIPTGAELANDLDLFIRDLKDEIGDRDSVEHIFGVGSDDNGLARLGSARAFIQNAAPTDIDGPGQYNSTAGAVAGTLLSTDEIGATTRDLGAGRLWVDADGIDTGATSTADDNRLTIWNETSNSFVDVTIRDPSGIGANNFIYNGSFEVTDGTGSVASTTVAAGWALVLTPTLAYASVANSTEGDGLILRTTGAGAALEGVRQTLAGLKESTTYVYRARVRATAGDTCTFTVGDGTTTASDVSATTGVFETLEVQHTTTAGPADVTVDLLSTADTDICDWDHVTAFERFATVSQPGMQAIYTQNIVSDVTIDTTFGNNPFVSTSVTIPSSGYIVMVDAAVSLSVNTNDGACLARLVRDDCAGGAFTAISPVAIMNSRNFISGQTTPLNAIDVAPVSGGTCIYRVEVSEDAVVQDCEVNDTNLGNNTVQTGSWLRLLLLPTR